MDKIVSDSFKLELENLQAKDSGVFKCILNSGLIKSTIEFEILIFEEKKPELFFNFIENDVRPFGEVLVICESRNLPFNAITTWNKIDRTKSSVSSIKGNRLSIRKLNKYDLNNYECFSESTTVKLIKNLELDAVEYFKESEYFYNITRNLAIHLIKNMTELKIGGKVTLKCTQEESDFEKKVWLVNTAENSGKFKILNDMLVIDQFSLEDYGTYSCLFIDIYGQKKIDFIIDENLIPIISQTMSTEFRYLNAFDLDADKDLNISLSFSGGLSDGYLRITCESNYFNENVKWSKTHGNFTDTNANIYENVLHIEPLELKDADLYTCSVTSPLGLVKKSTVAVTYDFQMKNINQDERKNETKIVEIFKFGNENLGSSLEIKCVSKILQRTTVFKDNVKKNVTKLRIYVIEEIAQKH
ncbi:hypothetical protein BpHYR1_035155 [Brachionus plicatilis]|uniref:Ig-like domain-containing protein n=1 Tax=Brachionus plicatilis TaxID=10195 RepID=A0A3M7SDV8_BRAPC|nr:hypothetical protein BpHYR1_035155 [Brachionus plicatilis]